MVDNKEEFPELERLKKHFDKVFSGKIDLSNLRDGTDESQKKQHFYTRSLAAYSLLNLANSTENIASAAVTDGDKDQGIDAILFDNKTKCLFIVSSKFTLPKNGVEEDAILKLIRGFDLILEQDFEDCNDRIKSKANEIGIALDSNDVRVKLVVASTSKGKIHQDLKQQLDKKAAEVNKYYEEDWVSTEYLYLDHYLDLITKDNFGSDLDLEVTLKEWGQIDGENLSVYGYVDAYDICQWHSKFGRNLFSENIRSYLGLSSDVNDKVRATLIEKPELFFQFNNGITVVCDSVRKRKTSTKKDESRWTCLNFKVVNGAQTVGTIYNTLKNKKKKEEEGKVPKVFVKIISLEGVEAKIGQEITIAANTQNRVEIMDFASMDECQIRLEQEIFKKFGFRYSRLRGEGLPEDIYHFSMKDAARALVSYEADVNLSTSYKRENSKFWASFGKEPYTNIFNDSLKAKKVVHAVLLMQEYESFIREKKLPRGREKTFSQSGDIFLLHLVFHFLPNRPLAMNGSTEIFKKHLKDEYPKLIETIYNETWKYVQENYPKVHLAKFLTAIKKVKELKDELTPILEAVLNSDVEEDVE